ncbi:MAG: hypothetical protein CMA35_02645, partial [Euryarchaeota archaeon]|nr:hypothetical protein [Euryarchaeota archaeon]
MIGMTEEYESMTVAQLKELLKEQGLPVSGKKADLIERLMESSSVEEQVVEASEEEAPEEEASEEDDFFEEDEDWDDDE